MQVIVDAFSLLFKKIGDAFQWIADLWIAIFVSLWDMVKDAVSWTLEAFLKIAVSALQAVDLGSISAQASAVWGSIPAGVGEVFSALGLGTALGVIVAAIGLRLVLQLIPFTRLGS